MIDQLALTSAFETHNYEILATYLSLDKNLSFPASSFNMAELIGDPDSPLPDDMIKRFYLPSFNLSLLFMAAMLNDLEMIKFLITAGVDIERGFSESIKTDAGNDTFSVNISPLGIAASNNFIEAFVLLLSMGADV